MQQVTGIKPIKINSDVDAKYLKPTEAAFILNQQRNQGGQGKSHPLFANSKIADVNKPIGENYCIGSYYSEITNELYSFHWNSEMNHYIQRINAEGVDIIANGPCLDFDIDPKYSAEKFRAFMVFDKGRTGARGIYGKYLVWSFGKRQPNFLDVELSLATDTFNLPLFSDCRKNPCDYFNLEFRQPQKCIVSEVDNNSINLNKSNNVVDKAWQWRYRYISYDGRASEYSPISSMNWIDHPSCLKDTATFPRCFLLDIPAGDAFVEKIELLFRNDNNPQWYLYDTIHKYGQYTSPTQNWYERDIELPSYNEDTCSFVYQFCGDRECYPVAPEETNRISNEMPNTAQTIVPIDNRLAFLNIERGNEPLPLEEKEKISFTTEIDETNCQQEVVKLKIALIIHCKYHDYNQFIYQMEDGDPNGEEITHQLRFGGLMVIGSGGFEDASRYGQTFSGDSRNFKVYVEGTEYWTELKQQYYIRGTNEFQDYGRVVNMAKDSVSRRLRRETANGNYFIQVGIISVPKGTRGFLRVMSHHAEGLEPNTSTSVIGYLNGRSQYNPGHPDRNPDNDYNITYKKEIYFNACGDDKEIDLTDTPFLVQDMANDIHKSPSLLVGALTNGTFAVDGYLKDVNGAPIQNARVRAYSFFAIGDPVGRVLAGSSSYNGSRTEWIGQTDHNGYYFFSLGTKAKIDFLIEDSPSGFSVVETLQESSLRRREIIHNDYTLGGDDYADNYTRLIKLKVLDCNGAALAGITVAGEGVKAVDTDFDGIARIAIRNNYDRNLTIRTVVMQSSICLFKSCDGTCNPCMDLFITNVSGSFNNNPETDLGQVSYQVFGNTGRFLKHGGRYEFGLTMIGNGRTSRVQRNDWFVDIPSVQELQSHAPVTVRVNFSSQVNWPDWVEYVSFSRSPNLRYSDYLQWVIDKIEYVDRDGNAANQLSASNLRFTIQSLNDYNAKFFFNTTTKYQYSPGDRIEFISNGNGEIFPQVINSLILSPFATEASEGEERPANFFNQLLISNDDALVDLEEGGIIEIQKAKTCETETVFQEICSPVVAKNMPLSFTLFTFDTYLLPRQIPGDSLNFTFEHHSITDFWGDHVDDAGRLNTSNEFERTQRLGRMMMVTDTWSQFGTGIGVNKFRTDQTKVFQGIEGGDIIAAYIWDAQIMLAICQHDNFTAMVGDDFLRAGEGGIIKVTASEQIVSNPQAKPSGRFGCGYDEVGSVYFGDGYATWIDAYRLSGGFIFGGVNPPKDVSINQISREIEKRTKFILDFNKDKQSVDKIRYTCGYDPHNRWVMLTMKAPRQQAINNNHDWEGVNKTICFDPASEDFPTISAFTPEAYGQIGQFFDKANTFITFFRSDSYAHYLRTDLFNTFFGIGTDRVVTICANENIGKHKRFLAIEVQSDVMWFAEKVTIDNKNFYSEIPPVRVKRKLDKWNAEFLRDVNSRGGLYEGKPCEGYECVITLVRDNSVNLQYKTIDRTKMGLADETDFFLVKYVFVDSSGLMQK